jgi:hypothetical protein
MQPWPQGECSLRALSPERSYLDSGVWRQPSHDASSLAVILRSPAVDPSILREFRAVPSGGSLTNSPTSRGGGCVPLRADQQYSSTTTTAAAPLAGRRSRSPPPPERLHALETARAFGERHVAGRPSTRSPPRRPAVRASLGDTLLALSSFARLPFSPKNLRGAMKAGEGRRTARRRSLRSATQPCSPHRRPTLICFI